MRRKKDLGISPMPAAVIELWPRLAAATKNVFNENVATHT
jgi:hypothetical protein